MKTMNQSLAELYNTRKITINDAMSYSSNTQELSEMLSKDKTPAFS
jgi:Tfp pilus assembly pilus retraction ATPase PilT